MTDTLFYKENSFNTNYQRAKTVSTRITREPRGGVSVRTLIDEPQKSYMLLDIGWYGDEYVHNAPIHIEIIRGKIRIQNDDTEEGVATDLLEAGVPGKDIVLGFRPPSVRPYTLKYLRYFMQI